MARGYPLGIDIFVALLTGFGSGICCGLRGRYGSRRCGYRPGDTQYTCDGDAAEEEDGENQPSPSWIFEFPWFHISDLQRKCTLSA